MGKVLKGILIGIGSVVVLALVTIGGLNVAKFLIYKDYYDIKINVCKNPGLNDDAIPQGIAVSKTEDLILTSCYMKGDKASRIYITDSHSNSRYVSLYKNDKPFKGHVGGLGLSNDTVYVTDGGNISSFSLADLKKATDRIDLTNTIKVNGEEGSASCIYVDNNYLYVGEFHDGNKYQCKNEIDTDDGKYYAICTQYELSDLTTPYRVYSLRNKVQGFCVTDEGKIVLSTSYGLASSEYFVYDTDKIKDSGETYLGAPLYKLDSYTKKIKGPAMSEDLSYKDGKVYTLTESASNKYIFGKLFGANKIVALTI